MRTIGRYKRTIFKILILCFLHSSCGVFPEKEKNLPEPWLILGLYLAQTRVLCNREGNFWVRNVLTNRSECLSFVLEFKGQFADFYRERRLPRNLDYAKIAYDFDTKIHPNVTEAFGAPSDINRDQKIAVLVLDIRDGAKEDGPFMAGFFDPVDLLGDGFNPELRSNQREILYIDGKELVKLLEKDPLAFGSTLAHEYQHLIRFPRMRVEGSLDDIWIDEGASELASDIGGFGPQIHRLDCFMGVGHSPCIGGVNAVSLIDWGRSPTNDPTYILKQYSYSYAFMRYLFENSSSTISGRNQFLYHTVNGIEGLRARDLTSLLEIFRIDTGNDFSAPFPLNPLGLDPGETFFLLIHAFFGQIVQGTDLSRVQRFDSGSPPVSVNLVSPQNLKQILPLEGFSNSEGYLSYIKNRTDFPERTEIPSIIPAASFNKVRNPVNLNPTSPTRIANSAIGSDSHSIVFFEKEKGSRITNTSLQIFTKTKSWNEFLKHWNSSGKDSKNRGGASSHGKLSPSKQIPICGHQFISNI